jgi:hypothetical protein
MSGGSSSQLWRRIRAAAILAGYRGPEELFTAIGRRGVSYRTVRRLAEGHDTIATPQMVADAIEDHCREIGVEVVPAEWVMHGFDRADH